MLRGMIDGRWYSTADMPSPGTELFSSTRTIRLWQQTVSHGQLLLRAVGTGQPTRVDLLFKPVAAMRLHSEYDGLVVRCATEDERTALGVELPDGSDESVFVLESVGTQDFVVAGMFGWHEDEGKDNEPSALSPAVYPYAPPWARTALDFTSGGLTGDAATLGELVHELDAGDQRTPQPDRYRYVHVVMVRTTLTSSPNAEGNVTAEAVYLTRAEAKEAIRAWADVTTGSSVGVHIEKWIEPVPVRL
jgi:hypothetical protein